MKHHLYTFNFKKKTKIFFTFIVAFFIIDRFLTNIFFSLLNYSTLPHAQLYLGKGKTDIMILGNSRGYRAFNHNNFENKINKKTKNYSVIGSSTKINEVIIKDYIDIYNEPPKIIILEISSLLSQNEALKDFRIFGYKSKRIANLVKEKYPKLYYAGNLTNLFQLNNSTFFNGIQKIFITYKYKSLDGYMNPIQYFDKNLLNENTFKKEEYSYEPYLHENISSLNRIIKLCKENDIKLYLFIAPFFPKRLMVEEESYNAWLKRIKENLIDMERIFNLEKTQFVNFAKSLYEIKYFNDWKHLNKEGTEKFQKIFFNHEYSKSILF